ncbi:immunity 49 family protein [Streptomyces sp. 3N207]|uniref:immunity 49 family protein n=1 Tax=Streptomyces sp. 3N207 TaxID=3457417 RepID=UPI003FD0B4A1
MKTKHVAGHEVDDWQIDTVLERMSDAADRYWEGIRDGALPLRPTLARMSADFVDYYAARAARDALFRTHDARADLCDAARCAMGVLDLGVYPGGDWSVRIDFLGETLSNQDISYDESLQPPHPTTARTWLDAFELCLISGHIWQWRDAIGLVLREDSAKEIRTGVPYAQQKSVSRPADLAQMNALSGYLAPARGHLPRDWPTIPLHKPAIDERLDAALDLDAAGPLTADQTLLRVLLKDDQAGFEEALHERLVAYRASVGEDPAPASLLPIGTITLAVLAVQAHGWDLAVESDYLFPSMLRAPEGAGTETNNLGGWVAK